MGRGSPYTEGKGENRKDNTLQMKDVDKDHDTRAINEDYREEQTFYSIKTETKGSIT